MSYGPGRYDPEYEERGNDYPLPYVRWTEKRNIESLPGVDRIRQVGCCQTHQSSISDR